MTSKTKLSNIDFKLEWKSSTAKHTDIYHALNVDLTNDKLPSTFGKQISGLDIGESCSEKFQSKDLLGEGHSSNKVISFKPRLFDTQFKNQHSPALLYRYYPSAIAWEGLKTTASDYSPFRLISIKDDKIVADCNHPLSKYYLNLSATKVDESEQSISNRPKRDIAKLVTSRGPGMQAPFEFGDPVFFNQYPFNQTDITNLQIPHIDAKAEEEIANLYSGLLPKHSKVLDLMSTSNSHLPMDYQAGLLTGLGANEQELSKNSRLDTYQVQNLNNDTLLPFESNSFDDAICTLSIEYISKPLAVMKEITRVVNSGGKFIITFSNNAFSDQTITLWNQLHPFERMQLLLEYFKFSESFTDLNTYSKRGLPRPRDDKDFDKKRISDPIFAVWGTVK